MRHSVIIIANYKDGCVVSSYAYNAYGIKTELDNAFTQECIATFPIIPKVSDVKFAITIKRSSEHRHKTSDEKIYLISDTIFKSDIDFIKENFDISILRN